MLKQTFFFCFSFPHLTEAGANARCADVIHVSSLTRNPKFESKCLFLSNIRKDLVRKTSEIESYFFIFATFVWKCLFGAKVLLPFTLSTLKHTGLQSCTALCYLQSSFAPSNANAAGNGNRGLFLFPTLGQASVHIWRRNTLSGAVSLWVSLARN